MPYEPGIPATFEGGVLRPDRDLHLPDRAKVLILLRRVDVSQAQADDAQRRLEELSKREDMRVPGWRFDRESLYDRN